MTDQAINYRDESPARSSHLVDHLRILKAQESTKYVSHDYLANLSQSSDHIDKWCRSQMIEWCFQVIDYIQFERETVIIAISYLDRFLSSNSPRAKSAMRNRKEYQLASMTSLYMAIKLVEPTILNLSVLTELGQGSYSPEEFNKMEMDILFGLNWLLNGPTALSFLELYSAFLPTNIAGVSTHKIIESARYQVELSAKDYDLVTHKPSSIAVAAMVQSVQRLTFTRNKELMKTIEELAGVSGYSDNIRQLINIMDRCNISPSLKNMRPRTDSRLTESPQLQNKTISNLQGSQSGSPRGVSN